jgi:predicted Zn-dependent protease
LARLEPGDYRPYRLIGLIHRDFEKYQEAEEAYRAALERSPPPAIQSAIVLELADSLVHLHQFEEALGVLADAPDVAQRFALEAECHWSLGRTAEAERAVAAGRAVDVAARDLRLIEARMRLEEGETQVAIDLLQTVLERDAHDFRSRYQLALARRELGDEPGYEAEMARMTVSRDLYTRLSELNKQAIAEPSNAELRDDLADVCRELGKAELATMWKQAAEAARQRTSSTSVERG